MNTKRRSDHEGAKVGKHTVRIFRNVEMDDFMLNPGAEVKPPTEPPLPARYNSETTLTAEVQAGSNEIDFFLNSEEE